MATQSCSQQKSSHLDVIYAFVKQLSKLGTVTAKYQTHTVSHKGRLGYNYSLSVSVLHSWCSNSKFNTTALHKRSGWQFTEETAGAQCHCMHKHREWKLLHFQGDTWRCPPPSTNVPAHLSSLGSSTLWLSNLIYQHLIWKEATSLKASPKRLVHPDGRYYPNQNFLLNQCCHECQPRGTGRGKG